MPKPKTPRTTRSRRAEEARLEAYAKERREAQGERIARSMARKLEGVAPAECDGEYEVLDR